MMEIAAIILSIIALIPFCAYLWLRWFYSPKIIIKVGGDQQGMEPIQLSEKGNVPFGISTRSKLKTFISEVWVSFDDDCVDLSKTKGGEKRITTDNQFPMAILFSPPFVLDKSTQSSSKLTHTSEINVFNFDLVEIPNGTLPFSDSCIGSMPCWSPPTLIIIFGE